MSPGRCSYTDVVVDLAWSNDLESFTGGSVATGRTSTSRRGQRWWPRQKGI